MSETAAPPIPLTQRRAWDSLMQWLISPLDSEPAEEPEESPAPDCDACRGQEVA